VDAAIDLIGGASARAALASYATGTALHRAALHCGVSVRGLPDTPLGRRVRKHRQALVAAIDLAPSSSLKPRVRTEAVADAIALWAAGTV